MSTYDAPHEQGEKREKIRTYSPEDVNRISKWMHWQYLPLPYNPALRHIDDPFKRFVAYMDCMTDTYPLLLVDTEEEHSPYTLYQKQWIQPTIEGKYDDMGLSLRDVMAGLGQLVPTENGSPSQQILFSSLLALSMQSVQIGHRDAAAEIARSPLELKDALLNGSVRLTNLGYDLDEIYQQNISWGRLYNNAIAQTIRAVGPLVLRKASSFGIENHVHRDQAREALSFYAKDNELNDELVEALMTGFRETNLFVMGSVAMDPTAFNLLHYR